MAEVTDVTFKICNVRVNCRAVAIIINDGKILFQKREKDNMWALPGGKIAILEKGKDTINRELKEEIGESVNVLDLYDVEENFFEYDNEKFHEYMFLYLAKLTENSELKNVKRFNGVEEKKCLEFAWFNREELDTYNIVPIQIKKVLKEIVDTKDKNLVKSKLRR